MVEVIVRRLQLACGLETYMFYSADSDEIIVKVLKMLYWNISY
jgi:hypothetical protein